ncbi:MAG: substrate-binding domain-containing protein [Fibrella sp.]|nr:substrate-binding domain-containing protein [Armatimonadota bacterium]
MARSRSERVGEILVSLKTKLRDGGLLPGTRFLSARELSATYAVSYQTAHRLLEELCAEGLVERRAASGTYLPGGTDTELPGAFTETWLILSGRARRPNSFGARLLGELSRCLSREGMSWQVCWAENLATGDFPPTVFPVLWESPGVLAACRRDGRRALLLNARPAPGLDSALVDGVSVDDVFGGACAADLLCGTDKENGAGLCVVTARAGDLRSDARQEGFLSRAPKASVVRTGGWYTEDGIRVAPDALFHGPKGIFCANDRLAEGVLIACERNNVPRPRLVGFDDAPVAATRELTTLAIPWSELAADAAEIIRRRIAGDVSAARRRIVTPHPVLRRL